MQVPDMQTLGLDVAARKVLVAAGNNQADGKKNDAELSAHGYYKSTQNMRIAVSNSMNSA